MTSIVSLSRREHLVRTYLAPLAAVAVALLLRIPLQGVLSHSALLFLFFAAVVVSAWVGGLTSGLIATLTSATLVLSAHSMRGAYDPRILTEAALFVAEGTFVSFLSENLRRSASRAERLAGVARQRLTEKTVVVEQLVAAHQKLSFHLENSPLAIIEWDHEFRVARWSKQAEVFFGWTEAEVLGHHPDAFGFVHSGDALRVGDVIRDLMSGKTPQNTCTNRNYAKDGRVVECQWYNSTLFKQEGGVDSILSAVLDVTEQIRATESSRYLAEGIPQIVWTHGPDDKDPKYNRRFYEYAGIREDASARERHAVIHPSDLAEVRAHWRRSMNNGTNFEVEYRIRRKDGVYRWHLGRSFPMRDGAGNIVRWFGTATDIDDLKRVEEELREARATLEQRVHERTAELTTANAELQSFAYVASHDLQEPLRMVASYTQLLERRYADRLDGDAREFIGYAVDGVRRMQELIEDLLALSRLNRRSPRRGAVDCNEVLAGVLGTLRLRIEESGAVVHAASLPVISGDKTGLVQLLQNLIGNALKFRSAAPPEISVEAERRGDGFVFSVEDNGIGIDPRFASRIFDVFQRLHRREEYPGTGVGLAICKKVVELHGGRIWVESEPGKGSIFKFTIPAAVSTVPHEAEMATV